MSLPSSRCWRALLITVSFVFVHLVRAQPKIDVADARQTVALGGSLSLTATGAGTIGLQWMHDGVAIAGATAVTYTIAGASGRDDGAYQVVAGSGTGSTRSAPVFVNVVVTAPQVIDASASGGTAGPSATASTYALSTPALVSVAAVGAYTEVPTSSSGTVMVAAGDGHGLALNGDGTVSAWGANDYGQATVPAGLSDVVAVAAGGFQSLALRADGTVVAWGSNTSGEATVPAGLHNVIGIAAGRGHCLAVLADGTVAAWGANSSAESTVPPGLNHVVAVACGSLASYALKNDGTVAAWGTWGAVPAGLAGVTSVAAGDEFAVALKSDGSITQWLTGSGGATGFPTNLSGVVAVRADDDAVIVLKTDGTTVTWTTDVSSGPGVVVPAVPKAFGIPAGLDAAVSVAASYGHAVVLRDTSHDSPPAIVTPPGNQIINAGGTGTFAVSATGSPAPAYQWYFNGQAIQGQTAAALRVYFGPSQAAGNYSVAVTNVAGTVTSPAATLTVLTAPVVASSAPVRQSITLGQTVTLSVTASAGDSPVYQWTHDAQPIAGATDSSWTITNARLADAGVYACAVTNEIGTTVSAPTAVNVAVSPANVVAWGANDLGQTNVPAGLTDIAGIDAGIVHTVALRANGTVTVWGDPQATSVPAGLSGVVQVSAGMDASYALRSDGTVASWGTFAAAEPTTIGPLAEIVAGRRFCAGITPTRDIVVWGSDPMTAPTTTAGVTAIAAGDLYLALLRPDGTVDGGQGIYALPPPPGLAGVVAIAGGSRHMLALKADGTVAAWGDNSHGEINVPPGLSRVTRIAAGDDFSLAVRSDGTVAAWGDNTYGQLNVPSGLNRVVDVTAGDRHSVAVVDASPDAAPAITQQPASQTLAPGATAVLRVAGSGTGTGVAVQWARNGVAIAGATGYTLVLPNVQAAEGGAYTATLSNALGTTTSSPANLTIDASQNPGRLINLSVLSNAGEGAQTLTVGFAVGGSGRALPLLLRGDGPSLQAYNVGGFAPNPMLTIYSHGNVIASNDDWLGDAVVTAVGKRVSAFALASSGSKDAALSTELSPGTYSMQITPADGTAGTALAEFYDATPAGPVSPSSLRLINVSALSQVGANGTLAAGFVIAGATDETVLIRGAGPVLTKFGVANVMSDPTLELYAGNQMIASNRGWGGDAAISAAADKVGAFGFDPSSSDTALLVTLAPGLYSAHVRSATGTAGAALIEVYEVR